MKAAVLKKYRKEIKVDVEDGPVPEVGKNDVLVKIEYAAVNPLDNMIIRVK